MKRTSVSSISLTTMVDILLLHLITKTCFLNSDLIRLVLAQLVSAKIKLKLGKER